MGSRLTQPDPVLLDYIGYSVGRFGSGRYDGVTLQFVNRLTGEPAHCEFNAELTRLRASSNGAKGDRLPPRQFRVTEKHKLYQFWLKTGLSIPNRPSKLHQHMGALRRVVFIASVDGEKINKDTLRPADPASLRDTTRTSEGHHRDSIGTTMRDKERPPALTSNDIPPFSTTGGSDHGIRSTVTRLYGEPSSPPSTPCPQCAGEGCNWCGNTGKRLIEWITCRECGGAGCDLCGQTGKRKRPEDQDEDEWIADYESKGGACDP